MKAWLPIPKLVALVSVVAFLLPTLYFFSNSPSIPVYFQPQPQQHEMTPVEMTPVETPEIPVCPELPPPPPPVPSNEIPNIVHFVHLLPDEMVGNGNIEFEFRHFLSIYSAHYYLNPDHIFIHTNAAPEQLRALENSPLIWNRIIANLPTVAFNHETAPTETSSGLGIYNLPNKSDFVRTRVMKKWGGIYMDEDVYLLKDLGPLRKTGFQNVLGRQAGGDICPGLFLSYPENDMITAYHALQDRAFDGGWATHAVGLLSQLAVQFAGRDKNVLVLEQDAFFPLGWGGWEIAAIYEIHEPVEDVENNIEWSDTSELNLKEFIDNWNWFPGTWKRDWHLGYALHGWNSGLGWGGDFFGEYGGITLEYVLAKSSNFARAVYPVVKHAMDNGIIASV